MQTGRSIHAQLLTWLIFALGLIGIFSLVDAYFSARLTANSAYDRVLSNSALTIAERIYVDDSGELDVDIPYVALDMLASNSDDRVYYRVDGSEKLITGYRQLDISSTKNVQWQYGNSKIRGEPISYARLSGSASNGLVSIPYYVTVAETQNARRALTNSIFLRSLLRQAAIMIGAFVMIWIAISHALRPLQRLTGAIARRNPTDLRPIAHEVPREVVGIVDETNALMERLSNALVALKRFTSNASHQLRTPLSIAQTELTLAKRATTLREKDAGIDNGLEAISGADRTLSQLLMLARIRENQSFSQAFKTIDLTKIASTITREFAIRAQENKIELIFSAGEDCTFLGDEVLIGEAIKNVLDNAFLHPKNCSLIEVATKREGDKVHCTILNDGAIKYQNIENGLGLSIVQEILEYCNGAVRLSCREPDVFEVSLSLPYKKD